MFTATLPWLPICGVQCTLWRSIRLALNGKREEEQDLIIFLLYIFTDGWPIWSEPEHNCRIFVWTRSGLAGTCCFQRERLNHRQRQRTQTLNTMLNLELLSYYFTAVWTTQSRWTTLPIHHNNSGHQKHCAIKLLTATVLQLYISYHWIVNVIFLTVAFWFFLNLFCHVKVRNLGMLGTSWCGENESLTSEHWQ